LKLLTEILKPHSVDFSARDHVTALLATLKSSAVKLTQEFSAIHKACCIPLLLQHHFFNISAQLRTESLKTRHERAKEYTNPSSKVPLRQKPHISII
jgi:hypothetical protein